MVKLSPEDQHNFSKDHPDAFVPVKGTWGQTRCYERVSQRSEEERTQQSDPGRLAIQCSQAANPDFMSPLNRILRQISLSDDPFRR